MEKVVVVLDAEKVMDAALADIRLEVSHSQYSDGEIEAFRAELGEMEERKQVLDKRAARRVTQQVFGMVVAFAGYIGGVSWATVEIGWDVIEPMTYMVTVSTGIATYIYFLIHKKNYTYEHLGNGLLARAKRKQYARNNFDLGAYEKVQWILDLDERKIKDPWNLPKKLSDAEHALRQQRFERVRDYIRAQEAQADKL